MFINAQKKLIGFKIVYYGAAMSGKTTNVRYISEFGHQAASEFLTLETRGSRTLYFDMLRLSFGKIGDYQTYFNLYTTPGQTVYITARRLVLTGADAVVFVMDSQQSRLHDNLQAWYTLERQLLELNTNKYQIPLLIQLNKRDMPFVAPVEQLLSSIHAENFPHIESAADSGQGVFETLHWVVDKLVNHAVEVFETDTLPTENPVT